MGLTPTTSPSARGITREEMDQFAVTSQTAAVAAQPNGFFGREIVPVPLPNGEMFSRDDGPRPGMTIEVLATLKPAFREDGLVTAGNACPLNDGAAAVVVMSDARARDMGIQPLARIVSTGVTPWSRRSPAWCRLALHARRSSVPA